MSDPFEDEVAAAAREERERRTRVEEAQARGKGIAWGIFTGGTVCGLLVALIGMPIFGAVKGCASKPDVCEESVYVTEDATWATARTCDVGGKISVETIPNPIPSKDPKYIIRCACPSNHDAGR